MNRVARMLSAMLAWSWMPGIWSSPNGLLNTSTRPDAVKPMKTILSLNSAGSIIGFSSAEQLLLRHEQAAGTSTNDRAAPRSASREGAR